MTTLKHEVEREAFEAHIRKTWMVPADYLDWALKIKDGSYQDNRAADQWSGWIARASYEDKGWRPIESAPRDASAFLAYRSGQVATASCLVREDGEMWSFGNQSGHRDVFPELVPTHWQPLPAAPSSHDGEGR